MNPTRPTKLSEFIGQEKVKKTVDILTKSASIRDEPLPHLLMSGPAGTGKTTLSHILASEIHGNFKVTNGASIKSDRDVAKYVASLKRKDVLFIDEVHRMNIRAFEWLYTIMEDFSFGLHGNKIKIPKFTLIGATTLISKLPRPFRERFKFIVEFEDYALTDLSKIVERIALNYNLRITKDICQQIARTCRGNPRKVVTRTEWIRDYLIAGKKKRMNSSELKEAFKLCGVDAHGLELIDHKYLQTLYNNGTCSLRKIASILNMEPENIVENIEPYLLQMDLIEIDRAGRRINDFMYDQIKEK